MTELGALPLEQLCRQCAHCLQSSAPGGCEPCRELLRRALCSGNDAAWDAAAGQLWPLVMAWIYAALPDLAPAAAEQVAYRALWRFRRRYARRPNLAAHFPAFSTLLRDLRHLTEQILADQL